MKTKHLTNAILGILVLAAQFTFLSSAIAGAIPLCPSSKNVAGLYDPQTSVGIRFKYEAIAPVIFPKFVGNTMPGGIDPGDALRIYHSQNWPGQLYPIPGVRQIGSVPPMSSAPSCSGDPTAGTSSGYSTGGCDSKLTLEVALDGNVISQARVRIFEVKDSVSPAKVANLFNLWNDCGDNTTASNHGCAAGAPNVALLGNSSATSSDGILDLTKGARSFINTVGIADVVLTQQGGGVIKTDQTHPEQFLHFLVYPGPLAVNSKLFAYVPLYTAQGGCVQVSPVINVNRY